MDLSVQKFRTKAEQELLDLYTKAKETLPGAGNPFVADLREKAIATYARLGLPHRRIEAWKYTDLRAHLEGVYPLATPQGGTIGAKDFEAALGKAIADFAAYRLVIVEGALRDDLSDMSALKDAGVEVASMAQALETPPEWLKQILSKTGPREDDAVFALNTALMAGGVTLRLPKGLTLDKPIHLIHLDGTGDAASMVTRNVIVAEEGASATVLESYGSLGMKGLQRNAVTEIEIGDKAAIHHIKYQREAVETTHLGIWLATIGADARYDAFQVSTGASLGRNQIHVGFDGKGSSTDISGVCLMRGYQHCDTTLIVEHRVPSCVSRELFKVVLDDHARGIFQGKVIVAPDAQKTDGKQMVNALLLSETAEFDSKPELEIFADDVVCGHGATSGQMNDDLLFYLESRGLPEAEARGMLIQAFVSEVFECVDSESLREAFSGVSADWLGVSLE